MTDAYFWVNGATEDEPVRCRAGSRRLGVASRSNRGAHGGWGGARALGTLIGPTTRMRPVLQYAHRWISRAATCCQKASTDSALAGVESERVEAKS